MKKLLIAASTVALLASATVPAQAGDNAAYLLGGVIGGLFIGGMVGHHNDYYVQQPRYYVRQEPTYVQSCYTTYESRWSSSRHRYVNIPVHVCDWVPAY